jgi:hypothetical protein
MTTGWFVLALLAAGCDLLPSGAGGDVPPELTGPADQPAAGNPDEPAAEDVDVDDDDVPGDSASEPAESPAPGTGSPSRNLAEGGTVADFEDGTLGPLETELKGNALDVVDDPAGGDKAARFTLSQNERVEVKLGAVEQGAAHCYSISFFIPSGVPLPEAIITQWHERPDRDRGEDWRIPPLYLKPTGDRFTLTGNWTKAPVNSSDEIRRYTGDDPDAQSGRWNADLGPVPRDQWVDFDFFIDWSYEADGMVQVARDGVQVFSRKGPNTYNDLSGNYWKAGMYERKRPGGETWTLYLDDLRQGPAGAGC